MKHNDPKACKRLWELRKRVDKARRFPDNTCPASRHLHLMAECLLSGGYPMFEEDPELCAESILAVLESLWTARTALGKDWPVKIGEYSAERLPF